MRARVFLGLLVATVALAGCSSGGAGKGNFDLQPQKVGWFVGEEGHFRLTIKETMFRSEPSYTIDRRFAIQEIRFNEKGIGLGGNYETRNPDDVHLRLSRNNVTADEFVLDKDRPSVDIHLTIPNTLKDSQYFLELDLFQVGWIESGVFRVDHR